MLVVLINPLFLKKRQYKSPSRTNIHLAQGKARCWKKRKTKQYTKNEKIRQHTRKICLQPWINGIRVAGSTWKEGDKSKLRNFIKQRHRKFYYPNWWRQCSMVKAMFKSFLTACAASSIITTSKARVILLKIEDPLKLRVENTYKFCLKVRILK